METADQDEINFMIDSEEGIVDLTDVLMQNREDANTGEDCDPDSIEIMTDSFEKPVTEQDECEDSLQINVDFTDSLNDSLNESHSAAPPDTLDTPSTDIFDIDSIEFNQLMMDTVNEVDKKENYITEPESVENEETNLIPEPQLNEPNEPANINETGTLDELNVLVPMDQNLAAHDQGDSNNEIMSMDMNLVEYDKEDIKDENEPPNQNSVAFDYENIKDENSFMDLNKVTVGEEVPESDVPAKIEHQASLTGSIAVRHLF